MKTGYCFLCLKSDHQVSECKKLKMCFYCKGRHSHHSKQTNVITSLVSKEPLGAYSSSPNYAALCFEEGNPLFFLMLRNHQRKHHLKEFPLLLLITQQGDVLLQTADVLLKSEHSRRELKVKVLFDSGSQRTYISEKASKFLSLQTKRSERLEITYFRY